MYETNMYFKKRHSQTSMNKIHREFHTTFENKYCADKYKITNLPLLV